MNYPEIQRADQTMTTCYEAIVTLNNANMAKLGKVMFDHETITRKGIAKKILL